MSCMSILGFRQVKSLSDTEICKLASRFNVPQHQLYKIDPKVFSAIIVSKNGTEKDRQNMEQPIQVLVFDSMGRVVTNLIDCNIGGFPILKWNVFKGFDSVPIRQGFFRSSPVFFSKNELDGAIVPMFDQNIPRQLSNPRFHYYILWSRVLFRNSKRLLKIMRKHVEIANVLQMSIDVKYIYSDSMYE